MALQFSTGVNKPGGRFSPDEIGNVYGKLTVIGRGPNKFKKNGKRDPSIIWVCKCECGNVALVRAGCLRDGNSKSCGCVRKERLLKANTKPAGVAACNSAISIAMGNARRRGFEWKLSRDEAINLMEKDCHYCGSPPKNTTVTRNFTLKYSGIDRVDNSLGYFPENCVPCCFICNTAKSNQSLSDFKNWILSVHGRIVEGDI